MCKLKFKPSVNNCWTTAARRIKFVTGYSSRRINYPFFPLRCCSRIVVSVVKIKRAAAAIVDQMQASCFNDRSSASLCRQPARRRSPIRELRVEGRTESSSQSQAVSYAELRKPFIFRLGSNHAELRTRPNRPKCGNA